MGFKVVGFRLVVGLRPEIMEDFITGIQLLGAWPSEAWHVSSLASSY